jgi:hypothetical protein
VGAWREGVRRERAAGSGHGGRVWGHGVAGGRLLHGALLGAPAWTLPFPFPGLVSIHVAEAAYQVPACGRRAARHSEQSIAEHSTGSLHPSCILLQLPSASLFCPPTRPPEPSSAMAATPPSQGALALVASITKLGEGLQHGEEGARESLLGACSQLIAELSHPSETMLQLLWAQPAHLSVIRMGVEINLFDALQHVDAAGQTSAEIASRTDPKTDPILVGAPSPVRLVHIRR